MDSTRIFGRQMFPFTRGVATSPGIGGALHVNDVSNVNDAEKHTLPTSTRNA